MEKGYAIAIDLSVGIMRDKEIKSISEETGALCYKLDEHYPLMYVIYKDKNKCMQAVKSLREKKIITSVNECDINRKVQKSLSKDK